MGDLILSNARRGRISMGCVLELAQPTRFSTVPTKKTVVLTENIDHSRSQTSDNFSKSFARPASPESTLLLPIRAHNVTSPIPPMSSPYRAGSPTEFSHSALETLLGRPVSSSGFQSMSVLLNQGNTGEGTIDKDPISSAESSHPVSSRNSFARPDSREKDEFDDYQVTIPSFSGVFLPPVERPFIVRIHSMAVFDLPSLHSVTANSPQVFLSYGEWKAKTSEAHRAGSSAEWTNVNVSFTVPFDEDGKLNVWTVLVRSGSSIAGVCLISIDELTEIPRKSNGFVSLTKQLKYEGQLRGTLKLDLSMESLRNADVFHGDDYSLGRSSIGTFETPSQQLQLQPQQMVAKLTVRMITVMELGNVTGAIRAATSSGNWSGSTMVSLVAYISCINLLIITMQYYRRRHQLFLIWLHSVNLHGREYHCLTMHHCE